jgi:hypothetical protein
MDFLIVELFHALRVLLLGLDAFHLDAACVSVWRQQRVRKEQKAELGLAMLDVALLIRTFQTQLRRKMI